MPIIRWSPFWEDWRRLEEELDQMFELVPRPSRELKMAPMVDIYQTRDAVVVETLLAGVGPEDVDISIEDETLTIKGKFEKKVEVEKKDYYRKEIREGSFLRTLTLPVPVKGEEAKAEFDQGLLRITIPKKEIKPKPKTIKVRVKKTK